MKKLSLVLATVCMLFMASCGNNNKNTEQGCNKEKSECCEKQQKGNCPKSKGNCPMMTEEQKQECKAFAEKWNKFDTLTADEQKELIAKKKSAIDEKRNKMKEMMAEMDKKWEGFESLTVQEQKEFLDNMPCCQKDRGNACCDKKPGECPKKENAE